MLFPNPAVKIVNLKLTDNLADTVKITLYDMTGKIMFCKEVFRNDNLQFDISFLPEAAYIIKVADNTGTEFRNILIKRN